MGNVALENAKRSSLNLARFARTVFPALGRLESWPSCWIGSQCRIKRGYAKAAALRPEDFEVHSMLGDKCLEPWPFRASRSQLSARACDRSGMRRSARQSGRRSLHGTGAAHRSRSQLPPRLKIKAGFCGSAWQPFRGNPLKGPLGRCPEAEASYRRALQINRIWPKRTAIFGTVLERSWPRFAEAEASYRRVLEMRPDLAEGHINFLGALLKEMGRPAGSRSQCAAGIADQAALRDST